MIITIITKFHFKGVKNEKFIANFRQTLPSLRKIDGISTKLERIKQYGNTLIPDIPEIFGKVILEIEKLDK